MNNELISKDAAPAKDLTPAQAHPPGFTSRNEWVGFQKVICDARAAGILPSHIKNDLQAVAIALKGRELGLEPLYALSKISMVAGRPTLEAELMRALVFRKYPDAKIIVTTEPEKRHLECGLKVSRDGMNWQIFSFTMEDAERAGLVVKKEGKWVGAANKPTYTAYPADMLYARATARAVRAVWPECIMGGVLPEEAIEAAMPVEVVPAEAIDAEFAGGQE